MATVTDRGNNVPLRTAADHDIRDKNVFNWLGHAKQRATLLWLTTHVLLERGATVLSPRFMSD